MTEPYISQINMFGFDFAPRTWSKCDGQLIPIINNQALYALLGTAFGGDGRSTFALPDLRGRVPVHQARGTNYLMGAKGGTENVKLTVANLPRHTHSLLAAEQPAETNEPGGKVLAFTAESEPVYEEATNLVEMGAAIQNTGDGVAHYNIQPSQVINFCIALAGLFPSRT